MDRIGPRLRPLLACALLVAPLACGSDPQGEPLGQEGAHEHGVADVSLVVEGREATVFFRLPAGDLFGFEGGEATQEEREVARAALEGVESSLVAMLGIPAELGCRVTEVSWSGAAEGVLDPGGPGGGDGEESETTPAEEATHDHGEADHEHDHEGESGEDGEHDDGGHSDVIGDFDLACAETLEGVTLRLAFTEYVETLEKIDLQAVAADRQFGRRVPASGARVGL